MGDDSINLFEQIEPLSQPLAARMRPKTLDEFVGQEHIMGEGRLLRRLIQADRVSSLLFYGPPGTGKTTLASVIANTTKSRFVILNAVLSGVKQLREALKLAAEEQSLYGKRTILFIDEVHRWNKSQQDALLPWVENGTVILIGATTENPYFEVNPALVSRSRIFRLKKLNQAGMERVFEQALRDGVRGYGRYMIEVEDQAKLHLIKTADGDARNLLNALELAVVTTPDSFPPADGAVIKIDLKTAEESIQQKAVLYDKEGDYHYDIISAFIKSIRGSDPDASLYWLSRMVYAGEDPRFIFRRMLISACEDIGLADPNAIGVIESLAAAFDRVGLPEGRFMLTQAALYLSTAKKSNSTMGFFDAFASVAGEESREVPNHLKDPGRDSKSFGHGKGYLYPHAFRDHWVAQQYLPMGLQGRIFYHPSNEGYESKIRDEVLRRREVQLETVVGSQDEEHYSWSPENKDQSEWLVRAEKQGGALLQLRQTLIELARIKRHHNILVMEEGSALLYWEALRQAQEGGVYLLSDQQKVLDHIEHYFLENKIEDIPLFIKGSRENLNPLNDFMRGNQGLKFDLVLGRNLLSSRVKPKKLLETVLPLLDFSGKLIFSQRDFKDSTKLSDLLVFAKKEGRVVSDILFDAIVEIENLLLERDRYYQWNMEKIEKISEEYHFTLYEEETVLDEHRVKIDSQLISQWCDADQQGYGKELQKIKSVEGDLIQILDGLSINWKRVDRIYKLGL